MSQPASQPSQPASQQATAMLPHQAARRCPFSTHSPPRSLSKLIPGGDRRCSTGWLGSPVPCTSLADGGQDCRRFLPVSRFGTQRFLWPLPFRHSVPAPPRPPRRPWNRLLVTILSVCFGIRAVSARGRVVASARAVQAAPPGWECSPWARRLCCTTYPGLPASSARSGRPMPHRSPGFKHPLTDADPPLKRARS